MKLHKPIQFTNQNIAVLIFLLFIASTSYSFGSENKRVNFVLDSLKLRLQQHINDTDRARTLNELADHLENTDLSISIKYVNQAIKIADSLGAHKESVTFLTQRALYYQRMGVFQRSIEDLMKALRIAEKYKFRSAEINTYGRLAEFYGSVDSFKVSEKYYLKIMKMFKEDGSNKFNYILYANYAHTLSNLGRYEEAINYFKQCLGKRMPNGNDAPYYDFNQASILLNIGSTYLLWGKLKEAEQYFNLSLKRNINEPRYLLTIFRDMGSLYLKRKEYKLAEQYFFKSITITERAKMYQFLPETYFLVANLMEATGREKEWVKYYKKFYESKDSLMGAGVANKTNELQIQYETEKKDHEISLLNKDKELIETRSKRDVLIRNSVILILVLVLTFVFVLIRNINLKRKAYKTIEQQNDIIEQRNAELEEYNIDLRKENISANYEVLKSKVNPHFLFNSLGSLSAMVTTNPDAMEFVGKFAKLYRLILESGDRQTITLREEIEVLNSYIYLEKVRYRGDVVADINIPSSLMDKTLPPFALQIVVENALKHNIISEEKKLYITIESEGNYIIVRNNLQKKQRGVVSTHTGQNNITARYLHLTTAQPSFTQTTTEYIVRIPLI